jgi:hypothetical protein
VSCPNSLYVYVPTSSAANSHGELLRKDVTLSAGQKEVVLDLEAKLPAPTSSPLLFFELDANPGGAIIRLEHDSGAPTWSLGGWAWTKNGGSTVFTQVHVPLPSAPLTGSWNHMVLDVVYDPTAGSATLTYDGADGATHTAVFNGPTTGGLSTPTTGEAILGMSQMMGAIEAPFVVHYDDVLVTVK